MYKLSFYKSTIWISYHWHVVIVELIHSYLFFQIANNRDIHNMHIFTLSTHVCKLYPYEHLQRLSRHIIKIDKITIGVSLSTGTLSTTTSTTLLNSNKFAPIESRTENLMWYWGLCNHLTTNSFTLNWFVWSVSAYLLNLVVHSETI